MTAIIQRMRGRTCGKGSAHRPPNLCANASQGGPAEHREEGRPNPRLLTGALISSAAGRSGVSSTNKKYFAIRFAFSAHHDSSSTVGDASWPQLVDSKQGDACQREILVSRLICK